MLGTQFRELTFFYQNSLGPGECLGRNLGYLAFSLIGFKRATFRAKHIPRLSGRQPQFPLGV